MQQSLESLTRPWNASTLLVALKRRLHHLPLAHEDVKDAAVPDTSISPPFRRQPFKLAGSPALSTQSDQSFKFARPYSPSHEGVRNVATSNTHSQGVGKQMVRAYRRPQNRELSRRRFDLRGPMAGEPNRPDESGGFGGRLQLIVNGNTPRELAVRSQRGSSVAKLVKQQNLLPKRTLVVGPNREQATRPRRGRREISSSLVLVYESPRSRRRASGQPSSLGVHPPVELYGLRHMEPGEKITAVQVERAGEIPAVDGVIERGDVAPELLGVEADDVVAVGDEHPGAKLSSQHMEGLPERRSSVLLVEVRP